MANIITPHVRLLLVAVSVTFFLDASAQTAKCPPLPIPVLNYQYQAGLKSGVGAELNLWFCPRKCDCTQPFGFVCYLFGPTASLKANYYPQVKTFDASASFGYRSVGLIFFKPELSVGYSFVNNAYGKSFFHVDPAVGFDIGIANIAAGYSFRSEKINDKIGGAFFKVGLSPVILFSGSKANKALSSYSKASKAEIKTIRKSR